MPHAPALGIPELAGLATYEEAARIGFSIDENVRRLLRYHWLQKRLLDVAVAHLPSVPEWELKCGLALHVWQDAEHASGLRQRIAEMRNPVPRLDVPPDPALEAFAAELIRARDSVELLAGIFRVARPALLEAYRHHLDVTNPLVDHPTRRLLRFHLIEEEEALDWGRRALAALTESDPVAADRADAWRTHLAAYLAAAGGVGGDDEPDRSTAPLPPPRATAPYEPDLRPRRDARFADVYNFDFPPHALYPDEELPADERNLALLCKRTLEMDVPEMMASFLHQRRDQPWEFYRDYARQLWDEARHAMMGSVALEARGIDWTRIPLNVGFSLRLNLHAEPLERQIMLYAIEQSLMPADTGKRYEYETAAAAGDALSAHFHDYDWADEVLHARIGRRWMKQDGISPGEAVERAREIHERTWDALDRYRSPDSSGEWWRDFVRHALGKESEARPEHFAPPTVIRE